MAIKFAHNDTPAPKPVKAKLKSLEDLRALVPAAPPKKKAVQRDTTPAVIPPARDTTEAIESAGRFDPKQTLRMKPDEWDMLDRLRGKLSRNDMIRVLVRGADRITGGQ